MRFILGRAVYNYTAIDVDRKNICYDVQGAMHSLASRGALLLRPPLTWGAFHTVADKKESFLAKNIPGRRNAWHSTGHFIVSFSFAVHVDPPQIRLLFD